jgi:hypothetical protein
MDENQARPVVGWRERVDFPGWGLKNVRAKIDTGARTSAIDVATIEELPDGRIRFEVVSRIKPVRRTVWVEAMPVRTSVVKPSHGEPQTRYVCLVPIRVGGMEREIEVSLVCRAGMLCRMLLGRTALGGLMIDPTRKYVLSGRKTRREERLEQEEDA